MPHHKEFKFKLKDKVYLKSKGKDLINSFVGTIVSRSQHLDAENSYEVKSINSLGENRKYHEKQLEMYEGNALPTGGNLQTVELTVEGGSKKASKFESKNDVKITSNFDAKRSIFDLFVQILEAI